MIALLQRHRVHDVRDLARLASLRSNILLHGSKVDLAEHDARRESRQRHHDLAVEDIGAAEDELNIAVLREAVEAAEAAKTAH